jgi:hypothetical protein
MSLPSRNSSYSSDPDVLNGSDPSASPASLSWILNDARASTTRSSSFPSTTLPTPVIPHQSPPRDSRINDVPQSRRSRSPRTNGRWSPGPLSGQGRAGTPLLERRRQRTSDFVESVGYRVSAPTGPPPHRERQQRDAFSAAQAGHRTAHVPPSHSTPYPPFASLENPFSGQRASSSNPPYMPVTQGSIGGFWSGFGQVFDAPRLPMPIDNFRPGPPSPTLASFPVVDPRSQMQSRGPERIETISRTSRACDFCKRHKTRCKNEGNTSVPCPACTRKGEPCVYTGENRRRGPLPGQARRSRDTPSSTPLPPVALPSMPERRGQSLPEVPRAARRSPQEAYHLPPLQAAGPSSTANQPGPSRGFARPPPPLHVPSQEIGYFPFFGQRNETGLGLIDDPRASMSAGGSVLPPMRDLGWSMPR